MYHSIGVKLANGGVKPRRSDADPGLPDGFNGQGTVKERSRNSRGFIASKVGEVYAKLIADRKYSRDCHRLSLPMDDMPIEPANQATLRARIRTLEDALAAAEERLDDALVLSNHWFWESDAALRLTHIAGHAWDGVSPGDLQGRTLPELASAAEAAERDNALAEMTRHAPFHDFVFCLPGKKPSRRFRMDGRPLLDDKGHFRGYRGVLRDITAEAEKQRRADILQRGFVEAIESVPTSLLLLDADDRIVICNSTTRRYFSRVADLLVPGTLFEDLVRAHAASGYVKEVGDDIEAWVQDRMRAHRKADMNIIRALDDGSWVQITERRTSDGGIIGIRVDITELKAREQALGEKAREVAEHAKELERSNAELEQFAYVASHDLQEPLRMVASYCQLLQRRYKGKLDANADEFIGFAVEGASRMQQLINDLLGYSRVGRRGGAFTTLDASEVLRLALANLQAVIQESGAEIMLGLLPAIKGDRTLIIQLFQNLIGNAIKFRRDERPLIRVVATADDRFWRFTVEDNGIGIEPAYIERVFLIFQRLHERDKYPGTGIGLAVARKVVEYHGGRIWIESTPGSGSRFIFTLPSAQSEASP